MQVNYGISKKTTFSIFKFFKSNQIKRYLYWWNMKSFMGIISEKNISLFKMKESKREKIMESCTPGRYVRTKKRLFFFDRNFSIWQNCSEKQRFYSFSREISRFLCLNIVLTLPPGPPFWCATLPFHSKEFFQSIKNLS